MGPRLDARGGRAARTRLWRGREPHAAQDPARPVAALDPLARRLSRSRRHPCESPRLPRRPGLDRGRRGAAARRIRPDAEPRARGAARPHQGRDDVPGQPARAGPRLHPAVRGSGTRRARCRLRARRRHRRPRRGARPQGLFRQQIRDQPRPAVRPAVAAHESADDRRHPGAGHPTRPEPVGKGRGSGGVGARGCARDPETHRCCRRRSEPMPAPRRSPR